ncbi:glycogen/starch/alpha-glucan phosphorylase [Palleronia rufa]|uniref:glycogen/starch/alpha-glucan phosphorylase n=1 Tax=Palleronia rufa TaxID=1530186 RepID=UPI00068E2BE1|nr:glycogen/starch/alpha-glucan phosphorylase [Palleronia rufa]
MKDARVPLIGETLSDAILQHLKYSFGKDAEHATVTDWRLALSYAIRDRIVDPWFASTRATYAQHGKRVYYLSMEFLIGRLLEDATVNLGLMDEVRGFFEGRGLDATEIMQDEPDAALGNGGLGRLAACFLESMSTVGCPAYGYGIRYEHGLFKQSFERGRQIEAPEDWLSQTHAWEFERPESVYRIGFGGSVETPGDRAVWTPSETVVAEAYDTPIVGWQGRWANTLRLWSATPETVFDLGRFNAGDYYGAAEPENLARTISRVLYPDDTTEEGKRLRLKQEFFFTAASLRDIVRRFEDEYADLSLLSDKVAIQLNDTHPAIAGPELVRILHDEKGMAFDAAVETARACLGYTNHTLLPEALERWSVGLMADLLPRHMQIIERIDAAHAEAHPDRRAVIIGDGDVQMGPLAFTMAHRVNGVSALHTGLMRDTVFAELNRLHPDRIVNETNGITPRRWLLGANPRLSGLITRAIGDGWVDDLEQLQKLEPLADDAAFREDYAAAKRANKADLADYLGARGTPVDPDALFDVQIKRIHEYKRQHLNILQTIALWQAMKDDPQGDWVPQVKIFGGKAAPGYVFAKEIIHLINAVAEVVNADPDTGHLLRVAYPANYNVSLAEKLIPAAEVSQQVSTAGKEASGTGNMKFALNGALTIGTLDGANVEIRKLVGAENFFLFGMTADEAVERRGVADHAGRAIAACPELARALDAIRDGTFGERFESITGNVSGADYFLVASDFADYWRASRELEAARRDAAGWTRMAILNTARSGWFSSDRTIRDYMADIWDARAISVG